MSEVVSSGLGVLRGWMTGRGMTPFPFQESAWSSFLGGGSGVINVPTGAGKTYASYLGPLAELMDAGEAGLGGLRVLYVTPLRAMSRDVELALKAPVEDLGLSLRVESRTGDTSSSLRQRQRRKPPEVLITTPESMTLLMTYDDAPQRFAGVRAVIVDEWHELMASKRGTQVELALARIRRFSAGRARTWALSATIANLEEAARAAVGEGGEPLLVGGEMERPISVRGVLPEWGHDPDNGVECRLPWAGHLGRHMLPAVLATLDPGVSTLVFCNTRSQAELWYQSILQARPEWAGIMGLHHGSIDMGDRGAVESGLKSGEARLVVCTSSLDLGVDFGPVERVLQLGSPKGIARLIQRAGRAGHRPGASCEILCVPTHALELIEIAAAREAVDRREVEGRAPFSKPLDVLAQHLVTCAMGGGFRADELFEEVRTAYSYRGLERVEFDWALDLVERGGETLRAYPNYRKVVRGADGEYGVVEKTIATQHRLNVGTITGSETVEIRYKNGRGLGHIEESFVGKLRRGEAFVFAGKTLRFERIRDMTAVVTPASGVTNYTPHWAGTRLPISDSLSVAVRRTLERVRDGRVDAEREPELVAAQEFVGTQAAMSAVPDADGLLVETAETREGFHLFVYPFDGRLVHEAIAAILALRLGRASPATFQIAVNDYGFELLSPDPYPYAECVTPDLFTTERLLDDIVESVNVGQLAKRQFREVARVSGLVMQSYPGARTRGKQVQANSSLIFDVFEQFDPENMLLGQARREVMEKQFERTRLSRSLERLGSCEWSWRDVSAPTPLGLPLVIERVGATMSTESVLDRIERMRAAWTASENPAGGGVARGGVS
ncbi:MAG: ligase-associated DNA damage response DEXH box helicase [Planctomycetota bacterium]